MRPVCMMAVAVLGTLAISSPVLGQPEEGACWRIEEMDAACIEAVTLQQCQDIYFWTDPGWQDGLACPDLEVPFEWDGSCLISFPDIGDRCALLWTAPGGEFDSEYHCEELDGGTWFANLICTDEGVPAMPEHVLALLAFALLVASLLALARMSRGPADSS